MRLRLLAAATAMLASSLAAHADTLFSISVNSQNYSFSLPDSAQPRAYSLGEYITYSGVAVSSNGSSSIDAVSFFAKGSGGGFSLTDSAGNDFLDQVGSQLYTGSEAVPTFTPGTFHLSGIGSKATFIVTHTSTPVVSTVTPEPSSLALLGTGILGLAGAVRRRLA